MHAEGRVSHMGAYGALGGGGRAGAREGRKDGTLQRLASARVSQVFGLCFPFAKFFT